VHIYLFQPGSIIVATPGKIIAWLQMGLDMSRLTYFVIDEVDRMLGAKGDGGFVRNVLRELLSVGVSVGIAFLLSI